MGIFILILLIIVVIFWFLMSRFCVEEGYVGLVTSGHNVIMSVGHGWHWCFLGPLAKITRIKRDQKADFEIKALVQDNALPGPLGSRARITVKISLKFSLDEHHLGATYRECGNELSEEALRRRIRELFINVIENEVAARGWRALYENPNEFLEAIRNQLDAILAPLHFDPDRNELDSISASFPSNIQAIVKEEEGIRTAESDGRVGTQKAIAGMREFNVILEGDPNPAAPGTRSKDKDDIKSALDVLKTLRGVKDSGGGGGGKKP